MNEESNTTARDFFWVSLLTGARKSNVLSMRWQNISFNEGVWRIPANQMKNEESISIPLSQQVIEILKQREAAKNNTNEKSPFVFPGEGRTGHLADPKKAWKRILNKAKIDDLRYMI